MAGFIILTGARRGQRYQLPPGIVTVGRQPGNTIVIPDDSLAPSHLLLSVDHEGCRIKDRSGGGTTLNGKHVATGELRQGVVFLVADPDSRLARHQESAGWPTNHHRQ